MASHSKSIFIFILSYLSDNNFFIPWYSYHCTQFLNFVNIDTPDMHFQFSALISTPVWYVKNPILVQHCSSSLKKSKFQFQFQNRFQKSESIPVQCLVTKTGTGNSNPPNSVQAQHWSKLQPIFKQFEVCSSSNVQVILQLPTGGPNLAKYQNTLAVSTLILLSIGMLKFSNKKKLQRINFCEVKQRIF